MAAWWGGLTDSISSMAKDVLTEGTEEVDGKINICHALSIFLSLSLCLLSTYFLGLPLYYSLSHSVNSLSYHQSSFLLTHTTSPTETESLMDRHVWYK